MMLQTPPVKKQVERIDLVQAIDETSVRLQMPISAMAEVGAATQTLAGLLRITKRETYVTTAAIAEKARVPVPTARKHLETLESLGWITNSGRGRTASGRPRRTCTIRLTPKVATSLITYGILPWWACGSINNAGKIPWSAKAVLSVILAQLAKACKAERDRQGTPAFNVFDSFDNYTHLFQLSLDHLVIVTGLSKPSVVQAKSWLATHKVIRWERDHREDGGNVTDSLIPNDSFRVVKTDVGNGRCRLEFEVGGKKLGNRG